MKINLGPAVLLIAFLAFRPAAPAFAGQAAVPSASSSEDARKVLMTIDQLQAESRRPRTGGLRQVEVTEGELNAYIAFRIDRDHEQIMKELRLKILPGNKLEGKIHADLRGQKIPAFIRPEMDIFFAGDLLVAGGSARIDMKRLFVGDQPIQPYILDMIIAVSAALDKTQATSLKDWYPLPYGIKDIKTLESKAVLYY